ncbi:hypothetical protein SeLEV6574_g01090 [Synchytrium endobioticum]|uniref:Uncharacterized protein n=1 Tax=Synchytrium endobioticum TaxID=286115 RepID=A0A507DEW4_9FUNG|nr:hypothetical protein SeLEV6574_g01090 [Synchytrium endobioticum]
MTVESTIYVRFTTNYESERRVFVPDITISAINFAAARANPPGNTNSGITDCRKAHGFSGRFVKYRHHSGRYLVNGLTCGITWFVPMDTTTGSPSFGA